MRTLVEALPSPIWARDEAGKLIYVNAAYARAVDAKDAGEVIARGIELFDRAARTDLFRAHEAEQSFAGRLPAIVAGGGRVIFDVLTFPTRRGSAGIGIDATEADAMRAELKRMVDAHRRTLDYLATGVAIFGADGRLDLLQHRVPLAVGPRRHASSTRARPIPRSSTGCATAAASPSSTTSANGRPSCTRPTARPRPKAANGTCPTAARCASSPRPIRKAA